ncbi:MAG: Sapep family Mn(2+)-dependent dipeptidase [Clostridia bacterium]|nr:Sapep family Mn(2+)-dependent dipeptidase [Clostridia bacterium]
MSKYFDSSVEFLKDLVKIKSVKAEPLKDMPFGKGINDALLFTLNHAKSLGFEIKNIDGYAGEIIFGDGKDEDGLAILCHLDVVPEGNASLWTYPPYSATTVGERIYGRGVLDNKGSTALCLYALKELKENGFTPSRKIKLIVGLDEESGSACMAYYKKVAVMPKEGFSPDGEFPVIYAEKGIYRLTFKVKKHSRILQIQGGEKINVVCDKAFCQVENLTEKEKQIAKNLGLKTDGDKVYSYGKNAHASTPDLGENAIDKLVEFLCAIGLQDKKIHDGLFKDEYKIKELQDHSGKLTMSPDIISCDDEFIYISVDVRYPVTFTFEEISNKFSKIGEICSYEHTNPLCVDKNGKFVQTLLSCYREVTGDYSEPIAIGGGTYAKELALGVAFGPLCSKGSGPHTIDEFMDVKDLKTNYDIYLKAIKRLCE